MSLVTGKLASNPPDTSTYIKDTVRDDDDRDGGGKSFANGSLEGKSLSGKSLSGGSLASGSLGGEAVALAIRGEVVSLLGHLGAPDLLTVNHGSIPHIPGDALQVTSLSFLSYILPQYDSLPTGI